MTPLVSVILPAYNAEAWIKESVQSILQQTYVNFELIIINDGSTDRTASILNTFQDERIKIIHQKNHGLAASLNIAIPYCSGKYIARMDADDICLPDRLKKQVDFLESNSDYGLIGANAEMIGYNGEHDGYFNHPLLSAQLKYCLLWNCYFVSPTIMFRKICLEKTGSFYEQNDLFEDYHMWSSIAKHYKIGNLPDVLLRYRKLKTSISNTTKNANERVLNQRRKNLKYYFPSFTSLIIEALAQCGFKRTPISSIAELRSIWKQISITMTKEVESEKERRAILIDLASRMHTFRLLTPENRGLSYFVMRIPEKIIYSLILR